MELAHNKMINDSMLWVRQSILGTKHWLKTELEKTELNFENSKTNYASARIRYADENEG